MEEDRNRYEARCQVPQEPESPLKSARLRRDLASAMEHFARASSSTTPVTNKPDRAVGFDVAAASAPRDALRKASAALRRRLLRSANLLLKPVGLAILPRWQLDSLNGTPTFTFRLRQYECFCHRHNCGFPPARMTERAVELAVADRWLEQVDSEGVIETGAVTPYYWPHRVRTVVDPYDPHPLVTHRMSLFDMDLSGRDVLAISTLEHIGTGDYGPVRADETAVNAFEKICRESKRFLVSVPYGFNAAVDATLFAGYRFPADVAVTYMIRSERGNDWREASVLEAAIPYGRCDPEVHSANGLLIVERDASCRHSGDVLGHSPASAQQPSKRHRAVCDLTGVDRERRA
jgi:hypothetical protein